MEKLVVEFPGWGFKIKLLNSLTLEKDCEMTKCVNQVFERFVTDSAPYILKVELRVLTHLV